jgi:ABC-type polysaccharide transport system permease subunit
LSSFFAITVTNIFRKFAKSFAHLGSKEAGFRHFRALPSRPRHLALFLATVEVDAVKIGLQIGVPAGFCILPNIQQTFSRVMRMDIKVLVIPIGTHVFVLFNNSDIFLMRISKVIADQSKGDEEQGPTGLIKHHLSGYSKQQVGDVVSTSCIF